MPECGLTGPASAGQDAQTMASLSGDRMSLTNAGSCALLGSNEPECLRGMVLFAWW